MTWTGYELCFRLRTPMHIGWSKVGNLQRTRRYLTGRALWGALTERLTRDTYDAPQAGDYDAMGNRVQATMAFTYLYAAVQDSNGRFAVQWPWLNESVFDRRFLRSYASTALEYPQQTAAETTLHEIEYIVPHTDDDATPVYLCGYIFAHSDAPAGWQPALNRLQIGGERGYGWGWLEPVQLSPLPVDENVTLFNQVDVTVPPDGERPQVRVKEGERLLAHTYVENVSATGDIEPLVGREWQAQHPIHPHAGQHVAFNGICWQPGSRVTAATTFLIQPFGIWQAI